MKNNSEFIIFKTEDETISVNVRMNEQDVWLTQGPVGNALLRRTPRNHTTHQKHFCRR